MTMIEATTDLSQDLIEQVNKSLSDEYQECA
jgi:hypothetical protein